MPRRATGYVEGYVEGRNGEQGHYVIRISCPDGSRPRIHLPPGPKSNKAKARAKETAAAYTERARREGVGASDGNARITSETGEETVAGYMDRWCVERRRRGFSGVSKDAYRLRKHVVPLIGHLLMTEVVRGDLESVVETLDERVQEDEIAWKSAVNTWGLVSKMFDDACNTKSRPLRVLTTNPAVGIRGPDRGNKKAKVYLYPSEFVTLVSCEKVPRVWRRIYSLATYLFTRASVLDVLSWDDFTMDREPPAVRIHQAWDEERRRTKTTKNKDWRTFSVEPTLAPLLHAMHDEAAGRGRLITVPRGRRHACRLREHLKLAGVDRASLFINDATRKHITFHDLKATGVTWMAVRGDGRLRIMQRAAHKDFKTTLDYIRTAEALADGFGDVFPELPASLLVGTAGDERPNEKPTRAAVPRNFSGESGIRTHGRLPYTRFPVVHLRPLGHLSR